MFKVFLLTMLIIAISVSLLCVKVILKKNGRFSSQHIHDNEGLRRQGIDCYVAQDSAEHK